MRILLLVMDDDQSIIILIFVGSNKQTLPSKIDFESTKPRRALKTSRVLPYLLFPALYFKKSLPYGGGVNSGNARF